MSKGEIRKIATAYAIKNASEHDYLFTKDVSIQSYLAGFRAGQIMQSKKLKELESQLTEKEALLKSAVEVIGFYANRFSWEFSGHPVYEMHSGEIVDDSSLIRFKEADGDEFEQPCGGRRAREFLAKLKTGGE